jgi:flagellar protein FliJ
MRFRFALEDVLRIRRIREDQQRNLLLAANAECDRIRRQLGAVEQDQSQRRAIVAQQIASGLWGAELQFDHDCRRQAKILRDQMLGQLEQAMRRTADEREKYLRLRRDRRAIEALRDNARQQFEREERRREQLALDEIHLLFGRQTEQNLPSD